MTNAKRSKKLVRESDLVAGEHNEANPLREIRQTLRDAMFAIAKHANRKTDLGRELYEAWDTLNELRQNILHYNKKGEWIG